MESLYPTRSRSRVDVFIHFVWATKKRQQWLSPEIEVLIYRCIGQEIRRLDCRLWAIGGTHNHLHVLVRLSARTTLSELYKVIKGASSRMARDVNGGNAGGWQDNYAAFSVSRQHLKRVIAYIKNQKEHHSTGDLWESVEDLNYENPNRRFVYPDEPEESPM